MVTKATHLACTWMIGQGLDGIEHFTLSGNLDTDKKHSTINSLHTRGKRVVAEVTIPAHLIEEVMHTNGAALYRQRQLSNVGSLLAGAVNNGAHYANGITAMFIACGQDVANVAEASAGLSYRAARQRRLLLLSHDPVAHRCHVRRRHCPAHPARVPRGARVLRPRQGPEAGGDRRRNRPLR
jgi:hydroxymethylglutaryl-CoA reductase